MTRDAGLFAVHRILVVAAVAVGIAFGAAHLSVSAAPQQGAPDRPMTMQEMRQMHSQMMEMRERMMEMREQLVANADAADAHLQELVDQMQASEGEAKIDAMAELLTALTEQHLARMRMGHMTMPGMMQMMGMMEHMAGDMEHMMRERRGGSQ